MENETTQNVDQKPQAVTFDEVLTTNKEYQGEFDRRVSKALDTAKAKWEQEQVTKLEQAKTEAEKLATMNAEQKAKYELERQQDELNKRIEALNRQELTLTAKAILTDKGLSTDFSDYLNYTDADTCKQSIEVLAEAFNQAVQKATAEQVAQSLRGNNVPQATKTVKAYGNMSYTEFLEAMDGKSAQEVAKAYEQFKK